MSRPATVPAPALVLGGIVSVQVGAALAQTLIPRIGSSGSVLMRLALATPMLLLLVRPRWRGHDRRAWLVVGAFGLTLGLMNSAFYGALAHLPIGVAVTVEFVGPLTLAALTSRRPVDLLAVAAAAGGGVVLISEVLTVPVADLSWLGLGLALTAGALWACYIVLSRRTGPPSPSSTDSASPWSSRAASSSRSASRRSRSGRGATWPGASASPSCPRSSPTPSTSWRCAGWTRRSTGSS
ncbi:membrane hypothetical protein [Nostocoides japonicum T1-X7]|uniref:EamA domain-containing protein n=1 Tax=Nostocoides japonicum T1-X7 TaxID=1194083 RepID=A0A077LT22_9MICO|nr:membrane hypothetical protein [Tetrasphaera japonica T1-X7]